MNEEELLTAMLEDKINSRSNADMLTHTNFLDLNQQSIARKFLKSHNIKNYEFYGGFSDCERKLLLFFPDYIASSEAFAEDAELSPIMQVTITKDSFSALSHRDYLGAVMGLGIRREMLGDLIVTEQGCTTAAMKNIAVYIEKNLTSVGRGTVKIRLDPVFGNVSAFQNSEEKRCSVSSMRADSVAACVFNLSRTAAVEKINRGEVFVNDVLCEKIDMKIPFQSKMVIRGKGKAIIRSDEGMTKKGKQAFLAQIFK